MQKQKGEEKNLFVLLLDINIFAQFLHGCKNLYKR